MSIACAHCRVLIIDDYADAADALSVVLEATGYEVVTAYDGEHAISAAYDCPPHVVLLDLKLPGIDGYEVARRLRKQPRENPVVIIALTSYGDPEARLRSQASSIDHHLVKPVDPLLLATLIASLVSE